MTINRQIIIINRKAIAENQAKANKFAFEETFLDKSIERMEQNQDIFEKILED